VCDAPGHEFSQVFEVDGLAVEGTQREEDVDHFERDLFSEYDDE